ncbi:response regulator [Paenibacillus sp. LMG 31460]|uniref:Response regulator n=1 Tax=Paenibacillus germinis TaxID=2654979 RepID=A0ABX1Z657_9BACL|nr:response regulator [Paenibacillus germinis]NOU88728.1 response regulator [Paenibacillus germinis]
MYKIAIVDDEELVREGIEELIQWKDHGFDFLGSFENGLDALEAFEEFVPDVVLTDIYMPFMDGLELTRQIVDKYPYAKVIMLTGYDEFEYVQQAIKLRVYDYLLKPISSKQLRAVLDKVKLEMDEEFRQKEDLNKLKIQLNLSLPLLRERFLESMVTSVLKKEVLEEKLALFDIKLSGTCCMAVVIDVDDFGERSNSFTATEQELMRFAVYNIVEEIMDEEKCGLVFRSRDDKIVSILFSEDMNSVYTLAQTLSEETRQCVKKFLKFTVTIGIGTACSSLHEIALSYQKAIAALDYRFLLGKDNVISLSDLEGNDHRPAEIQIEWEKKLVLVLKTGTVKEVNVVIEDCMQNLKLSRIPMQSCMIYIQKISVTLMSTINELGGLELLGNPINPFAEINTCKTLDEIEMWLKEICKKVIGCIAGKRNNISSLKVGMAEEYIMGNYSNETLSVNDVCQHLQMSPSYFGTIFKTHTGETLIEYLTRIRIEKAMELLKYTDLKTYEIANKIGYRDPHYFSLIFKKKTGLSPTEYRERISKEL